ncbi:MAG: response regulator [Bacteroidales bacterium]
MEDEINERKGIEQNIPWNELGIAKPDVFASGKNAFDHIIQTKPDILLTDIKMPGMDGIELARRIKKQLCEIKIIFISGYDDFEYAKDALEIKAVKYILKPYELQELVDVLKDVVNQCRSERLEKNRNKISERKLRESMPLLRNKFHLDLLNGVYADKNKVKNRISFLDSPLMFDGEYYVNVIEINHSEAENKYNRHMQVTALTFEQFIEENLTKMQGVCLHIRDFTYVVIISFSDNGLEEYNYQWINSIMDYFRKTFQVNLTVGTSVPCRDICNLNIAYKQAVEAARNKFFAGENEIIKYEDVGKKGNMELEQVLNEIQQDIIDEIKLGKCDNTSKNVEILFNSLKAYNKDDRYVRTVCINIINTIELTLWDINTSTEEFFGHESNLFEKLLRCDTVFETQTWMKNMLKTIADNIASKKNSNNSRVVNAINKIIEEEYSSNITLNYIASKVYLSAGYVTSLYKKETGENIMDVLLRTRIKKAKELLCVPELKIYEVADSVGYKNVPYFSTLFKNSVGVSPSEYRDSHY